MHYGQGRPKSERCVSRWQANLDFHDSPIGLFCMPPCFRVASKDGLRIQPFAAERSLYSCEYSLFSLDKSEYSAYNRCILLIREVRYDLRK